ncbi:hypothetical protein OE88DRAFT_1810302 [Heliocybe sulcata]|uniref:Uncharacterized protein n=1 Tax=Heliocybe sulcata TaxID=5364 RepID=A0A5C3MTX1_9AGAM|nr:hypothetical protein OE88DRAFT_1810302 [Heliocybe sulcata]
MDNPHSFDIPTGIDGMTGPLWDALDPSIKAMIRATAANVASQPPPPLYHDLCRDGPQGEPFPRTVDIDPVLVETDQSQALDTKSKRNRKSSSTRVPKKLQPDSSTKPPNPESATQATKRKAEDAPASRKKAKGKQPECRKEKPAKASIQTPAMTKKGVQRATDRLVQNVIEKQQDARRDEKGKQRERYESQIPEEHEPQVPQMQPSIAQHQEAKKQLAAKYPDQDRRREEQNRQFREVAARKTQPDCTPVDRLSKQSYSRKLISDIQPPQAMQESVRSAVPADGIDTALISLAKAIKGTQRPDVPNNVPPARRSPLARSGRAHNMRMLRQDAREVVAGGPAQDTAQYDEESDSETDSVSDGDADDEEDGEQLPHVCRPVNAWKMLLDGRPKLSPVQQVAKQEISLVVRRAFRDVCGVAGGKDGWPDPQEFRVNPETRKPFLAPDFRLGVTHSQNVAIFKAVQKKAGKQLKKKDLSAPEIHDPSVYFDNRTLYELAKEAFNGWKQKTKAKRVPEYQAQQDANDSMTRRLNRRKKALAWFQSATPQFQEVTGRDVSPILHRDFLSDYASGPKDVKKETKEQWKCRMALKVGINADELPAEVWEKMEFLEHINPLWRSRAFIRELEALHTCWWNTLDGKQKRRHKVIRVYGTGRVSIEPPLTTPHNFAISNRWWKKYAPNFKAWLVEWGMRGNPQSYNDEPTDSEDGQDNLSGSGDEWEGAATMSSRPASPTRPAASVDRDLPSGPSRNSPLFRGRDFGSTPSRSLAGSPVASGSGGTLDMSPPPKWLWSGEDTPQHEATKTEARQRPKPRPIFAGNLQSITLSAVSVSGPPSTSGSSSFPGDTSDDASSAAPIYEDSHSEGSDDELSDSDHSEAVFLDAPARTYKLSLADDDEDLYE